MDLKTNVSGLVLAGGRSSRMGQDKGLINFRGAALVEYAINALRPYCSEVLLSANSDIYKRFNLKVLKDSYIDYGPLAGIYEGLKNSSNEWVLVTTCDMPNINHQVVEAIVSNITDDYDCIVAASEKGIQPLVACYHKRLLPLIKGLLDDRKLKMMLFVEQRKVKYVAMNHLEDEFFGLFANLNQQSDLNE